MPFRVDFKALRRLRRSRDAELLDRVLAVAAAHGLDADDDEDDDPDDDGEDLEGAAVHRFLHGLPPDPNHLDSHELIVDCACALSGDWVGDVELKWISQAARSVPPGVWRVAEDERERVALAHVRQHLSDVEAALLAHDTTAVPLRQLFESGYPPSMSVAAMERKSVGYLTAEATRRAHEAIVATGWKDLTRQVTPTLSLVTKALAAAAGKGHGVLGQVTWIAGFAHLMMWTLDVPRLEALRGSRSEVFPLRLTCLFRHNKEYFATGHRLSDTEFMAWHQTRFPKDAVEEPAPDLPAVPRAAWEILYRSRLDSDRGHHYVSALHLICIAIGERLDNDEVAPAAPAHFTAVDEALERAGLDDTITMQKLVFDGAPISIPECDDFPAVGHLSPAKVKQARGLIASRDWSAEPAEVQATLRQVNGWLDAAAAHNHGLVCFYT